MTATGYISVGVAGPQGPEGDPGPPGADSTVPGPAGAPGFVPVVRQAYVTNLGRIALPDTAGSWLPLAGFPTLSVPAAVGDYVEIDITGLQHRTQDTRIDAAVLAGGAPARFMASGTATPGAEGDDGWIATAFEGRSSARGFVVQAGDLTAGNVVFCLALRNDGTGTLDASDNYPFYWRTINYGVVQ